jgi:EAL domain-containing protein (putative c-di-GMP-specific phosphodiesterase class I)
VLPRLILEHRTRTSGSVHGDPVTLIHTLVELGRTLGLDTLAEGIEHQSQLGSLRGEQCDSGQAFIFSKPVPPEEIEARLADARDSLDSMM